MAIPAAFPARRAAPGTDATSGAEPRPPSPARSLTGRQKAAIIVRFMLAEGADLPIAALPDHLQAALAEQMGAMRTIGRATLAAVVEEFCAELEQVGLSFPGGLDGALRMLDGRLSATAAGRIRRLAGASTKVDPWEKLRGLEPARLRDIAADESDEVAAVILSKLAVPRAAEILGQLPGERARRIALAMSRTGAVDPETVRRIGAALVVQLESVQPAAFDQPPAGRVGAILNLSTAATRDDVLSGLDVEDAALAAEVRRTIFTFAHIPARIAVRDVPKLLRAIDQAQLVQALAGAPDGSAEAATAEFLLSALSQRMAATLREEMAEAGRVKAKEAEAAQTALVAAVRELAESGELTLIEPESDAE